MTINPIVAPVGSRPGDPWAGIWLAEDVEAIHQGVSSGSWIDSTLGGVGAGLDTLAAVSDPLGTLMQYGLSWLMEHIRPLSEALDWLAGDPAQIAAHSQTWRNVAASLRSDVATFGRGAGTGVSGWQGTAATAYQTWASRQKAVLGGLASAADTMASISDGVAYLIAGVRVMVRDAIATVVSRAIDYAGEEFFSFGLATPWVIEQVSTLVASWSARIGRWITALRDSVGRLTSAMGRLGEIVEALKKLLRDDRGSIGPGPIKPKGRSDPLRRPQAPIDPDVEAARVHALGIDPAQGGKFNPNEAATAARIEEHLGVTLDRNSDGYVDWEDRSTAPPTTYDAVGPFDGQYFERSWPNLQKQIVKHLGYADMVPVDVSGFTPAQTAVVRQFIEDNNLAPRAFLVGN